MIVIILRILFLLLNDETKEGIIGDTLRVRIDKNLDYFSYKYLRKKLKQNISYRNIFFWRINNELKLDKKQLGSTSKRVMLFNHIQFYSKLFVVRILLKLLKMLYRPIETIEIAILDGCLGKGLYLPHRYCVITAKRIGDNVTIHHGVTIGKNHKTGGVPTIGNNVVIFPNAVIVGDITIGDNTYIGANTFVNKDIPSNSTIRAMESKHIER